jgi:uncharacterized protein
LRNPFTLGMAGKDDFCDRDQEMEDLLRHARNGDNTVLYSPRRYGKSSLIAMVLDRLGREGFTTVYVDLFPITSEQDFISRFSTGIFKGIGRGADPRTVGDKVVGLFKKMIPSIDVTSEGYNFSIKFDRTMDPGLLLDDLLEGLYTYATTKKLKICIALDEFQEITELPESKKIEGILRSHIQIQRDIGYFFVGSRRRILNDMFSNKSRAFYKSAFSYVLREIPDGDFSSYIVKKFKDTGKKCTPETALEIYDKVRGYPYYVQKLASIAWDLTTKQCAPDLVGSASRTMLRMEAADFEGIWSGLTLIQRSLLKAIAQEPTPSPYAREFLERHRLSVGGTQKAMSILLSRDLIEKDQENKYRLTDPVMGAWLKET